MQSSDHYNISYTTTLRNTIRKETEAIHKIDLGRKRKNMFDCLMIWCQDYRTKFLRVIKHSFWSVVIQAIKVAISRNDIAFCKDYGNIYVTTKLLHYHRHSLLHHHSLNLLCSILATWISEKEFISLFIACVLQLFRVDTDKNGDFLNRYNFQILL